MPGSDRPRIGVFAGRLRVSRTAATCGTHERRAAQLCETHHVSEVKQLAALARIQELLTGHGIDYWLFGGWAVDFHAGVVTRVHDDLDIAVWLNDHSRIAALLAADRWRHAPEQYEDGHTGYERGGLRLELAFLERSEDGHVYTPTRAGRVAWPTGRSRAMLYSCSECGQG
jgi:hypothetical protein